MIASGILFYGSFTFRTLMSILLKYPIFIHLILWFAATFIVVPRSITCKTNISLTFLALHFLGIFILYLDNSFASRVWTEIFLLIQQNIVITFKFLVFLENIFTKHHLKEFFFNFGKTLALRAFYALNFATLCNRVGEILLEASKTKLMTTFLINEEIRCRMVVITDGTIFLWLMSG